MYTPIQPQAIGQQQVEPGQRDYIETLKNLSTADFVNFDSEEYVITKLDEVKEGFFIGSNSFKVKGHLNDIYNMRYDSLWAGRPRTLANGLKRIKYNSDIYRSHICKQTVDKHINSILAEPLKISEEDESIIKTFNQHTNKLNRVIRDVVKNRILLGRGVFMVRNQKGTITIESVNAQYYFPVRYDKTSGATRGHLLVKPFSSKPNVARDQQLKDRCLVTKFDPDMGINSVTAYTYQPEGSLGRQLGTEGKSDIIGIYVIGEGLDDSLMIGAMDALRAMDIAYTQRIQIHTQNAMPLYTAPGSMDYDEAKDAIEYAEQENILVNDSYKKDSGEWNILAPAMQLGSIENAIRDHMTEIHNITKTNPQVTSYGQSGLAKQEERSNETQVERQVQNEILYVLPDAYKDLTNDVVTFVFAEPQASTAAQDEKHFRAWNMGFLPTKKAYELLGYGIISDEEAAKIDEQRNASKQNQGNNSANQAKSNGANNNKGE